MAFFIDKAVCIFRQVCKEIELNLINLIDQKKRFKKDGRRFKKEAGQSNSCSDREQCTDKSQITVCGCW